MTGIRKWLTAQEGYSLLELLLVLAILGMIIFLVLPLYPTTASQQEIHFVMKQFEEDFFYFQQKAITDSKLYRIVINPKDGYYYAQELEDNEDSSTASPLMTRHLPSTVKIRTEFTNNSIVFDNKGHLSQGGNVRFVYQFKGKNYQTKYIFQIHTGRFRVETFTN